MANLIFGGHKIGSSVLQFSAARGITSEIENTSKSVGISDGEMLINSRLKSRIIPVTYDFVALSRREFERQLAPLLYSTDVQKLIIDDRPDEFWYAKVDGKIDMDRAYFLGTGTINFLVPDGIAHSVATKTADNMPYKDVPVNLLTGTGYHTVTGSLTQGYLSNETTNDLLTLFKGLEGQTVTVSVDYEYSGFIAGSGFNRIGWETQITADTATYSGPWYYPNNDSGTGRISSTFVVPKNITSVYESMGFIQFSGSGTGTLSHLKLEKGSVATPWSPNPADPEYYTNTITVHNGGTYPVEPVITATMHADNGFLGFANSQGGVLQFGNPEEIDGYTSEESEVALNLAAVKGSHMDNQAASNNLYWGGDPSKHNEQIGNAIWTHDDYDGWKVEPNWPSITGDHKYWNGPSIKHNLAQTHNGNFKSNLTWDVMTRFQTNAYEVGALETTLESDGKPIFQMILKDNSALSDQIWWMCYYKNQLVVNEQLDRNIFTNDKFIQMELQKFGNSVVFRVSPWVGNRGRETTITRQFTFADAADVETKQFSTWFMRDKTWGESTMYLIASTVKWQNVNWYTNIKNRFSDGDVLKIDVANTKTYLNGSLDPTMHTIGNQWEQFELPPGDTKIGISHSSWAQPFACEVEIREAWL
ncbi:phage tail family protein [Lacticaseibacillus paracasei]|uniref:distal tail protein Dit n=1 Tax=Lacticaseibacillus paracasei TaxID=1597 RepID=UPI001C1E7DC4|nr:distal tail protein Dit [Lacticaseibacillus paracasei]MBU6047382.1 phage tail family protein [Lacticaseibacillus paracasei]MCL4972203.1 phage tail family protein [Lacticaseibacillus paracasei]